jgi:hypothetical protein
LHQVTTPEISGAPSIYPQADALPIGQPVSADVPDWNADPAITTVDIQWQLCNSEGNNCADITGATNADYSPVASDAGNRLRIKVTGSNGVESTVEYSAASNLVETPAPPIVEPPATQPPPIITPIDPFPQPTAPKSLGKLKLSKKNTVTLSKLNLLCGETATGPCTGSITFTTAKTKKHGKTIKSVKHVLKLSVAPRRTMPTTFKLSSAMVKAVKAAKSLKTSIAIKLGAPGFSSKSLRTGATLSLK